MIDKALNQIAIAMKAGKVKSGEFACEEAIKSGIAYLCIVACDASDNTKKAFKNSCDYYDVKYVEYSNKESLGQIIGKVNRASICIIDEGLADSIVSKM